MPRPAPAGARTQIEQGHTGRGALHLAEAIALGLAGNLPSEHPERLADRPSGPSPAARGTVTAAAGALAFGAGLAGARFLRHRR
ncbi:hypothetical protein [Streptomyces formicae]